LINLSALYSNYIDSLKETKERDPYRLFISDVGKCPRQVGYRLIGADKNYVSEQTLINKNIMFEVALHMEEMMMSALEREGILIAFQEDVEVYDRENWGGRLDFVADVEGIRVVEFKTVASGAFRHGLDYPHYRKQSMTYDMYCRDVYGLEAVPLLPFFDRGGTNTWQYEEVQPDDHLIASLMDELDAVRVDAQNDMVISPKLPKKLFKRSYEKQLVYEPPWDCGWCDWSDECNPDMGKSVWAERKDSREPWTVKKAADRELLMKWATKELENIHE
jgi:hypothetical protein